MKYKHPLIHADFEHWFPYITVTSYLQSLRIHLYLLVLYDP